jgi:hypothetical protein
VTARFDYLIRLANRLAKVEAGSPAADQAIHAALGRSGPVLPYTRDDAAVRELLPEGFETTTPAPGAPDPDPAQAVTLRRAATRRTAS